MAVYQMVPTDRLLEPLNPQRQETLLERIDELRDSMRTNGLQQPIGVEDIGNGEYRIIWGHRRSIAATQLGWTHIAAMVHAVGEADHDQLMGAENYHRTQVNDKEEALYYKRIIGKHPEGTIGLARELNVPQSRIENLLMILDGDEKVIELLGQRKLSVHQAMEINKFKSPGYRLQATQRAVEDGVSGERLRQWRQEVQRNGLDQSAAEIQVTWTKKAETEGQVPQANCQIGNHMVPLQFRKIYEICNEHYNVFLEGLEALGRERVLQEAGLWSSFQRLIAVAEGSANDGGRTIQPGDIS